MPSCKGPKRAFELVPSASDQQGPSKSETDKAAAKSQRQRTGSGNSGDEFEEFVAVLDGIQYMKTKHAGWHIWSPGPWHTDVKVIKTETPWIPSFELTSLNLDPRIQSRGKGICAIVLGRRMGAVVRNWESKAFNLLTVLQRRPF